MTNQMYEHPTIREELLALGFNPATGRVLFVSKATRCQVDWFDTAHLDREYLTGMNLIAEDADRIYLWDYYDGLHDCFAVEKDLDRYLAADGPEIPSPGGG